MLWCLIRAVLLESTEGKFEKVNNIKIQRINLTETLMFLLFMIQQSQKHLVHVIKKSFRSLTNLML
jgi:hypothetical protein